MTQFSRHVPGSISLCLLSFLASCGSPEPLEPSGTGATNAGGTSVGGASTGGSATTGGAHTGGSASTGGSATTGGTSTGGSTGGASGAGNATTGGTDTGGSPSSGGSATSGGNAGTPSAGGMGGAAGSSSGSGGDAGSTGGDGMGGTSSTGSSGDGSGGASGAGSNSGGSGGGGDGACDLTLSDKPVGFASLSGGTVGGGNVAPIPVSTAAELKNYLADSEPRVLHVMQDLDFRTENRTGVQICVDNVTCSDGNGGQTDDPRVASACGSDEHASTSYRNETVLTVASNKTVIGIGSGSGASVRGASLRIGASQQIILRNLKLYDVNPHLVEAGDGITLQGARFVWLDHLHLSQISDGFIDIGNTNGTTRDDNITLSWIHFDGRAPKQCGGKHHFINLVENGHVTYHHNWFDNSSGRNPKLGGEATQVHLFNNYWLNVTYFCITAQKDAEARVESNYFENSARPHWLQTDGNGTAGIAVDEGNTYTGASTSNRDTGGTVFSVPYEYTKQTAQEAKDSVMNCSGPQSIR